jgi:hypothetical protein
MLQKKHAMVPFLKKALVSPVLWSVFLAAACGSEKKDTVSEVDSFPRMASRWDDPNIPVCWESSADGFATEKAWVREKVESQYEESTNIRFDGWRTCKDSDNRGIRITVADAGAHTKGLGKALDGVRNGMLLNFTFENWSSSCQANPKRCIQGIAVHEFGHAVGLAHEQNRPDTPSTCVGREQGTQGDVTVGTWDLNSVMNYCNPVYNNNGNLTEQDIEGINRMYGTP